MEKDKNRFEMPHPEVESRTWTAIVSAVIAIVGWVAIFVLPNATREQLLIEIYVILGASIVGGICGFLGIKKSLWLGLVGLIGCGTLLLTMILALIGFYSG